MKNEEKLNFMVAFELWLEYIIVYKVVNEWQLIKDFRHIGHSDATQSFSDIASNEANRLYK